MGSFGDLNTLFGITLNCFFITAISLGVLILDPESTICQVIYLSLMWIPAFVSGVSLFTNYLVGALSKNERDTESITILGALWTFFLFVTSWALLLVPFWLYDPLHSFEEFELHYSIPEIWIKMVALSLVVTGSGGFMTHVPESWFAMAVVAHLGYIAFIFIVFGIAAVTLVVWDRTQKLKHTRSSQCDDERSIAVFFRGPYGVFLFFVVNIALTILILTPLIIEKHSSITRGLFMAFCWIPYVLTLWNLIVNYMLVLFNKNPNDDDSISIPSAIVSYMLHAYSWAMLLMLFWLYDPDHSFLNLEPDAHVLMVWSKFASTSLLVSFGGEFMFYLPASWLSQITFGMLIFISFPFIVVGFASILGMVRERTYNFTCINHYQ